MEHFKTKYNIRKDLLGQIGFLMEPLLKIGLEIKIQL